MDVSKSTKTTLKFTNELNVSTYSRTWSDILEIDFTESATDGINNRYELEMPIDKARYLVKCLTESINSFDETKAKERAEKEAADKEAAENLAVESQES